MENLYIYHTTLNYRRQKSVLVPSTGNLYIYCAYLLLMENLFFRSRPLHGESIYLLETIIKTTFSLPLFSSPPRGIYISTKKRINAWKQGTRSRPLHGESIYLRSLYLCYCVPVCVLVPSTGNLYIYQMARKENMVTRTMFSSPPRGIYISTNLQFMTVKKLLVLVPSTGNLYIYNKSWLLPVCTHSVVLVPSTGNLYIYVSLQQIH